MNPRDIAIALEMLGVGLIVFAIARDDLQTRYPWLR